MPDSAVELRTTNCRTASCPREAKGGLGGAYCDTCATTHRRKAQQTRAAIQRADAYAGPYRALRAAAARVRRAELRVEAANAELRDAVGEWRDLSRSKAPA